MAKSAARPLILAFALINGSGVILGDEPNPVDQGRPASKAIEKNRSRIRAVSPKTKRPRGAAAAEPPLCRNHPAPERPQPGQSSASMPQMFDQMIRTMEKNPAGGFQDFLKIQEQAALQDVTLSQAEERTQGQTLRRQFLDQARQKGFVVVNDAKRQRYLEELVNLLAKRMTHRERYPKIEVTLIESSVPDAQSFPGGFLIFTTGLLEEPDEATVVAVIAHELAHLDLGHLNEYAKRSKLMENNTQSGRPDNFGFESMMQKGMALGSVMMNPFRPEHELAADCQATTWMFQEAYDPMALVEFFDRLHARLNDAPDVPFFSFGRSHPYSLDRRREVLNRLNQLQRWKPRPDLGRYPENLTRLTPKA